MEKKKITISMRDSAYIIADHVNIKINNYKAQE